MQGFEGLTVSTDGKSLYALMQSALNQEGGLINRNRISGSTPSYEAEYVVPLPFYSDGSKVAAQSEIHYISDTQFPILARDSNAGRGQASTQSVYRQADVCDISNATDIKNVANDAFNGSIASTKGVLDSSIQPAQCCSWLNYNVNSQLDRLTFTTVVPRTRSC